MRLLARLTCALILLLTAGFCGFGFLATFEPGPSSHEIFRAGYAVAGFIATSVAAWLLLPARTGMTR
jgi:hypothetical protein